MNTTIHGNKLDTDLLTSVLEKTRSRLLDQTRRNRLLNYKETAKDIAIIDEMPDQVFEHLVQDGGVFYFEPYPEPEKETEQGNLLTHSEDSAASSDNEEHISATQPGSVEQPNRSLPPSHRNSEVNHRYTDDHLQTAFSDKDLERRLRKLYTEHRTIIEETGANNLYLAIGFLRWYDNRQERMAFQSPLILLPVRLEKERGFGSAVYKMVFDDEALDTNYSLYEKLKHDFDIRLPLLTEEQSPEGYWEEVDKAITPFKLEGWEIVREMELGLFRFHKQVMWHDLDPSRWPDNTLLNHSVLQRILLGAQSDETPPGQLSYDYNPDDAEQARDLPQLTLIRDADSSQYNALVDAIMRKDGLVIEGPPGTGKSQTITNLITAALTEGLSVLFVAEKMAALEVVHKRLEEANLGEFCLQLHGLKTGKKELLEDVARRIDHHSPLPAHIEQRKQSLQHAKEELIEVQKALSAQLGPENIPLYEAIWRVERLRQTLPHGFKSIEVENPEELNLKTFRNIQYLLNDLGKEWAAIPKDARDAWHGFVPTHYAETQQPAIQALIGKERDAIWTMSAWLERHHAASEAPTFFEVGRLLKLGALDGESAMSTFPAGTDMNLAHTAVHSDLLPALRALLDLVGNYLEVVRTVNQIFDYQSEEAGNYAENLNFHGKQLANTVCGAQVAIADLPREKERLQITIQQLELLPEMAAPLTHLTNRFARTLDDYQKVAEQAKELAAGPIELSLHATPFHVKATAKNYLDQAKKEHVALRQQATEELELFDIARIGDTQVLREANACLVENRDRWFVIFNGDYRRAKKLVRGFMRQPGEFSRKREFLAQLEQLAAHCEQRDQFAANENYRTALGTLFRGTETNWHTLESIIDFSGKLRERVGSENARKILLDWDEHVESMEQVSQRLMQAIEMIRQYATSQQIPETLWQRPVEEITATLRPLVGTLQNAINTILQPWCNSDASLSETIQAADSYRLAKEKEAEIESHGQFDRLLRPHWKGAATHLKPLRTVYDWLYDRLKVEGINLELLRWLMPEPGVFARERFFDLLGEARRFSKKIAEQNAALKQFGEVHLIQWIGGSASKLDTFGHKLGICLDNLSSLPLMMRWQMLHRQVCEAGCEALANAVSSGELIGDQCGQAYEFSVYENLLKGRIAAHPQLAGFTNIRYENLRERYAKLDREVLQANAQLVAACLCQKPVPKGVGYGSVRNYTELSLLRQEAQKKRRHIPVRQLIHRAPTALKALKPCFLMSPLSVAQYLAPGQITFDLVVMDEASQMRPEDALGAIARGSKVIVVGDPKQLPPTSFFDVATPDDDGIDDTALDDTESILDVCLKQFPYRRLRWHYRSKHEALIQFSNEQFYDDDLIVFPSPQHSSREYGVHCTFVDTPSYRSGRNRGEAELVVENIIHHFRRHPNKSLGVAAFNRRQAEEIQLLLERARSEEPAVDELIASHEAEEPLFIKNLENVQGDERDVIFISTTYGPERPGEPVYQRFGPLNSDIGWRRLNVIITRARERVEVFTSLRPSDIRVGENARRGVRALRDYLEYASTGRIPDLGTPTGGAPDSEFEVAVSKVVENLGFKTIPQVGVAGFFIDIGVKHPDRPGEYLMGIECDGATYHSARSVRDRDRLRQEILESKGWHIHRIWSTNWFHTRSAEIDRLKRALEKRLEQDRQNYAIWTQQSIEPEVLKAVDHASYEDIAREKKVEAETLEEDLHRFWEKNIKPEFPNVENSILNDKMIELLAAGRPQTEDQWFTTIPIELRQHMDPRQKAYLADILDLTAEYR